MRQYKILVGDTDAPFEIRVPAIGVEAYLAPVKLTSIAGNDFAFDIEVEVAQSGTAGYNGFLVNVVETSVGSGEKIPFNVKVGGASRLLVDNEGKVGIGAIAPIAKAHIKFGNSGFVGTITDGLVVEGGDTAGGTSIYILSPSVRSGFLKFGSESVSNSGYIGYAHTADDMEFGTTGVERMRIDSAGNVGIGNTPSGTYKLEVTGNVSLEDLTSTGGVVVLSNLPTSDPTNAGQLWNDSNTLKISAG